MPTSLGHLSNRVLAMADLEACTKPCYIVMYLLILSWIPNIPLKVIMQNQGFSHKTAERNHNYNG